MISIVHLLDDFGMGGVTRALSLFDDPRIRAHANSEVKLIGSAVTDARHLNADLIVIHVPPRWKRLPYLVALRALNPRTRIVQVEHSYTRGFEKHRVSAPGRFRRLIRLASRLVDEVIAVSKAQSVWLAEVGVSDQKLSVIHPWSGRFDLLNVPARKHHSGPLKLLTYGRFSEEKGFLSLVQAVASLPQGVAELVVFGAGPQEAELRLAAASHRRISIKPATDNPAPFLAECDAVVVPSKFEAFGLVPTEARLAGRATLLAHVDGLPEQAAQGGSLVCPMTSPASIAEAIRTLSACDLDEMGQSARRGVLSQHENIVSAWIDLIRSISLSEKPATYTPTFGGARA
ncbi:glycosyltransferase family 4 protein [Erythrobacter litoralis]|uniref:glycosyltransferase family 4 protein n=1 Tax=Erythrobacter litoralis TaxID=39960 RepID=UPI00243610ED|nr:glycosyltransferase family 4 protein [Erythrobacter litoralis]